MFDPNNTSEHILWHKEVFRGLHSLNVEKKKYDIVLLTPPTSTNIKIDSSSGPPLYVIKSDSQYQHLLKLKQLHAAKNTSGDPITSRIKPTVYHFNAKNNYDDLIVLSADLVAPGGYLVAVTNSAKLTIERMESLIEKGFQRLREKLKDDIKETRYIHKRQKLREMGIRKKDRIVILKELDVTPEDADVATLSSFKKVEAKANQVPIDFKLSVLDSFQPTLNMIIYQREKINSDFKLKSDDTQFQKLLKSARLKTKLLENSKDQHKTKKNQKPFYKKS